MKINTKTILIAAAVLVALVAGYLYFSSSGSDTDVPVTAGVAVNSAQAKFETLNNELQPITFDTAIFSDPRFNALVDISTEINPEPSGRLDPFAPIAGVGN